MSNKWFDAINSMMADYGVPVMEDSDPRQILNDLIRFRSKELQEEENLLIAQFKFNTEMFEKEFPNITMKKKYKKELSAAK